ncbi:hypothetical protein [Bradyrhizobium sp. 6(2017)]|uniref:hypothetical protein n=1 Tax=Bradyrhizobium sp. 6(2017) TaxID=1197460 RepID=UPI0013E1AEA4|nr:hypothetical protein [Bradyrhizobium sp. 6(2017)]QIG92279.1 hypothetical protein G6P99_07030 [Bradyrhizobium sp. 6(2017)]
MPVKRRVPKQRSLSPADELRAWSEMFDVGFDFFDDLEDIGLSATGEGHPLAEDAWRRLGAEYLRAEPADKVCWALEKFGRPWETRYAR